MPLKALIVEDNVEDFDLIDIWPQEALGDRMPLDHASSVEAAADLMGRTTFAVIIHDLFCHHGARVNNRRLQKFARDANRRYVGRVFPPNYTAPRSQTAPHCFAPSRTCGPTNVSSCWHRWCSASKAPGGNQNLLSLNSGHFPPGDRLRGH